jgi:hypothetical protein
MSTTGHKYPSYQTERLNVQISHTSYLNPA